MKRITSVAEVLEKNRRKKRKSQLTDSRRREGKTERASHRESKR
jgi:hypothetical protein